MSETNIQKLIEMYESVKNLKAVKCGIAHERVLIDKETDLPVTRYIGETVYERIGLCPLEVRKDRIACGHTMASYILEDALTLLDSEGKNTVELRNELMSITTEIFQLDHKKGFAEADLANLFEKQELEPNQINEKDISSAKEEIRILANGHNKCVDKIAELQKSIVNQLEKVIEYKKG